MALDEGRQHREVVMKRTLLATVCTALLGIASLEVQAQDVFTVYFGFDRSDLDAAAMQVVDDAAARYTQAGTADIVVAGYTDRSGSPSYNLALSERRAEAVRAALEAKGVPASSIAVDAEGENNPAVMTADGQREARNRRVVITMQGGAPAMAEAAPAPAPAPEPAPEPMKRGMFNLGLLYGFNLEDQGGTGSDDKTSHLVGVNVGFDYALTSFMAVSLEQAGFYNFFTEKDGLGGRSAAGLDFGVLKGGVIPHIGGNIGYLYGSGIEDSAFAGPEIGLNLFGFDAKVAYDMPFNRSADKGIVTATVGTGIRF